MIEDKEVHLYDHYAQETIYLFRRMRGGARQEAHRIFQEFEFVVFFFFNILSRSAFLLLSLLGHVIVRLFDFLTLKPRWTKSCGVDVPMKDT